MVATASMIREAKWPSDMALTLRCPCLFYLGAIGCFLYLLALMVLAPFWLPFLGITVTAESLAISIS